MGDGDRLGGGAGDGGTGITGQQASDSLIHRVTELEIVPRETKEGFESDVVELQQEKVETAVLVDALENDVSVAMEDPERMRYEDVQKKSERGIVAKIDRTDLLTVKRLVVNTASSASSPRRRSCRRRTRSYSSRTGYWLTGRNGRQGPYRLRPIQAYVAGMTVGNTHRHSETPHVLWSYHRSYPPSPRSPSYQGRSSTFSVWLVTWFKPHFTPSRFRPCYAPLSNRVPRSLPWLVEFLCMG
ncbi:hypothetical protein BKA70DRAFT_282345 [Coprinopsis sp. MPI-PUGE-AT-0042]|nr:hypothetical protein BKA70DRAFT_282345 [Coprinopsis sp. MPI-PUGE-AT-0042]